MYLKPNLIKTVFVVTVVAASACSEQAIPVSTEKSVLLNSSSASEANRAESVNPFNTSVGAPIDFSMGERWIDNYGKENATSQSASYTIKADALNKILSSKNCVGVSFMYALDPQKRLHILPVGVDNNGKQITSKQVYTQNGTIAWKTAQCWVANYTGPVQSHFFGQNTFLRLWTNGNADVVVTFARDDNNNPQLLLTTAANSTGKVAASSNFEDASSPCPPVCPK
ncbi:MAG TPA: hypothetical protein VIN08_16600 [Ohtaekwangia sp.]|uniref:hypothetical protein n=1 Tax=Ohtaekwangia sp. TaxID=2066019 RepID=UPI002F94B2A8